MVLWKDVLHKRCVNYNPDWLVMTEFIVQTISAKLYDF
jgi:hypothetical protein